MAEVEQRQALTLHVQQLTGAMVDWTSDTERSTAAGDERKLDGAQHERIEAGSGLVRVAGPKDSPQGATLRASDVVENLRVPMESLPHRSGQEVSRASGKIDDPTKDVRNGDLDLENQELSVQLYFALVLVMPRESVGISTRRCGKR